MFPNSRSVIAYKRGFSIGAPAYDVPPPSSFTSVQSFRDRGTYELVSEYEAASETSFSTVVGLTVDI
jgi:hypothetical protein